MRKDNPAVRECPRGSHNLHGWIRRPDGGAECKFCKNTLTKEQADDCFYDTSRGRY